MTNYEHLPLPKVENELPRRARGGGGGKEKRSDRSSHGSLLLTQASSLIETLEEKANPFGINPKLIFKIKVRKNDTLENHLPSLGLNLLAKEPKAKQAIVVFADDNRLTEFKNKLESYAGTDGSPGYLDDIEELVPLEPEDRMGPLLKLDPLEPGPVVPLDMELWHTGNQEELKKYIDGIDEVLKMEPELGMRVSDRYIGSYICNVRIFVNSEMLELLLEEYQVKEIDRRPKPAFESPAEYRVPLSNLPEISSPPEEATGVLVIDSGVQSGHPLIGPALGEGEVFPDRQYQFVTGGPDDGDIKTGGHGTGVSGIAIYGDVAEGIKNKLFQPQVWLFSARVTNENNEYEEESLLENQLEEAIDYFVRNYPNCKVINISLGNSDLIYQDGEKQFRLAARIDEIAYELRDKNILFVISAGNFWYEPEPKESREARELIHRDYPNYLLREDARIIDPATAAIALTVGSLSMGKGSSKYPNDAKARAIAKVEKYPSPFTRSGFGVDGVIKPDLVEFGGDLILDGDRIDYNDWGPAIMTLNKDFPPLFKHYVGTSFSTPRVANLAAKLFTKFPNASSNLIRALIADSAQIPTNIPSSLDEDLSKQKIYGNGQPNFERAAYSTEDRVLLLEDNQALSVGSYSIYEVPALPRNFLETKGTKKISVTLAFDPPTRHTRGDSYLGITMEFHLFRNVDKQGLTQAFTNAQKIDDSDFTAISRENLEKKYGKSIEIKLFPNLTARNKGTLQKGQFEIKRAGWKYDYKPLYLVVACNKKWVNPKEIPNQRYALIVSIVHSDPKVDLYNQIKLQIQGRIAERIRI